MQWWMHAVYDSGGLAAVLGWVFWVIFSICLHELAHGWAAIWQGDRTPRETGHMTMNPMVHMGGASLIVFALVGIAWGLMPTDPSRYRWGRRGRIAVAAAGPLMNLLIAVVSLLILVGYLHLAPSDTPVSGRVINFLYMGGMLNLVLLGLNLMPIPPLDGSQMLMGASYRCYVWFQNPTVQQYSFFALLALFFLLDIAFWAFRAAEAGCTAFLALFGALPTGSPPI
ncbi:MAG: site-2 protease family protein [Planctomycetota bacterium]|nr:site-2 protease family protein [Planctomycetota bacterium]MEC8735017.1 site-2 protease family protein [Planctomycetota bacterium]MEC9157780.1 site-2 protease family protein [Planctomycetota bacterium]MEC9233031.1 site-2 protease family protein [Planctomycetota bacterium]MED5508103.1 site-2 protease family protein [Planctomycetota bacterium]